MVDLDLNDWFNLVHVACTPFPLPKVKRLPFDPLLYQMEHLELCMESKGLNKSQIYEEYPPSPANGTVPENDYRTFYSHILSYFLMKIAKKLEEKMETTDGPSNAAVLSLQQLSFLKSALEFFIPTAIRPYAEKGVLLHLGNSDLVKHWKEGVGDVDFRKDQLKKALKIFDALMNACDEIRACVLKNFLTDYICLNEQLFNLGEEEHRENYEKFILSVNRPQLITSFFVLLTAKKEHPRPGWLMNAVGSHISRLLQMENGLYHLITAITESANGFGDFQFVRMVSKILVLPPRGVRPESYRNDLIKQFMYVMKHHPNAEEAAVCFALFMSMLPNKLTVPVFDELLEPWEIALLGGQCSIYKSGDCYFEALDNSLRILSLYMKGLPPDIRLPCFDRFKRLFNFWTLLYASYDEENEKMNKVGVRKEYQDAVQEIYSILHRVLHDPSFKTTDNRAEFLVRQVETFHEEYLPELRYGKIVEDITEISEEHKNAQLVVENAPECSNWSTKLPNRQYRNICIVFKRPEDQKDVFIRFEKGILKILEKIEANSTESTSRLSVRTAMCCIERWGKEHPENGKNSEDNFEEGGVKVNCFFNDLLSTSLCVETLLDGNLSDLLGIPLSILDVATAKVNMLSKKVKVDIRGKLSEEDLQLQTTVQHSVELALTILHFVLVSKQKEIPKFKENLQRGANVLQAFSSTVTKLDDEDRRQYTKFQETAHEILTLLKANDIEPKECDGATSFTGELSKGSSSSEENVHRGETFSFQEIREQLSDEAEFVRGHALVMLARGIQKRNKQFLDEISNDSGIMLEVMKHVTDDDSYVYLSAINAVIQLAYWKRNFFDDMVEFFLDPTRKLKPILDEKRCGFSDDEKETYLLIQRVKIGEAIAKANKMLGEMAPAYVDRMVGRMLSLLLHAKDDELRASVLSSLSDLIISCHGLKIHAVLSELVLASQMCLRDVEADIVRRAAVNLLRAIIKTYDIHLLQEIPAHLRDIKNILMHILDKDADGIVKMHARLCLQDIDAQMVGGFLEFENTHTRKIRIPKS